MKLYESLKSMIVYTQNGFVFPKGTNTTGFGNCMFLLAPKRELGVRLLQDNFIDYRKGLYKHYMIDYIYREKIGYKKYVKNNTGIFKKEFKDLEFPSTMKLVTNGNKVSILKRNVNMIVNLGEWLDIYSQFYIKKSAYMMCQNFLNFITSKMNTEYFTDYKKYLYIDIDQWINGTTKLGLDRKSLTNPISILLLSVRKFPELLLAFRDCEFIFVSKSTNKVMMVSYEDMIQKNAMKIRQKIVSMISKNCIDEEALNDENADVEETEAMQNARKEIINSLTKKLIGDNDEFDFQSNDVTELFDDEDNESQMEILSDDEEINEIKDSANKYIDEHPELLTEVDREDAISEVTAEIKKKHYVRSFKPSYTDEQIANIKEFSSMQENKFGTLDQSISDMKSKIIDEDDVSNVVNTNNVNALQIKFANFDKNYNKKKMPKDIDNTVMALSNTASKIFVVDKEEEDTSDSVNLKKTVTYTIMDELGRESQIKLDIPIVIDDHFLLLNGNKKIIEHMLILKPIVKTGRDAVQIVTNYRKMFIMRKGSMDLKANAFINFMKSRAKLFDVSFGNASPINRQYKTTMEFDMVSRKYTKFKINENLIILNIDQLKETLDQKKIKYQNIDQENTFIIGIDVAKNKPITMSYNESFIDKVMSMLEEEDRNIIKKLGRKNNGGTSLQRSDAKIMCSFVPLVLLLCYFEGFKTVMQKANIEYQIIPNTEGALDNIDLFDYGVIELSDGYIVWKRYPTENSLLLNGFNSLPMNLYSMEELESKDSYLYLLTHFFKFAAQATNLDQFYDFMIDPITKEILIDMGYPTDLVSLCLIANKMLKVEEYTSENDLRNMRMRSTEVIAYHTYQAIADAYGKYRKTLHRKTPDKLTIKQDAVIRGLKGAKNSVMSDASSLNPVLEVSRIHGITYKGENGTNLNRAFKLGVRAYTDSMVGVLGITTTNDLNTGINRQMTLEPNITSTRGYIETTGKQNVENLSSTNLLTPAELLTPLGVLHDDPARTAMAYKQSIAMVLVEDSDPVLIGNGIEKTLPYYISSDFTIVAEDDGVVVDKTDEFVVIKYKNGKYRTIDTSTHINKNSSAGFYVESQLTCNKKVGDSVTKNEVVAWNDKAFAKKGDSLDAAMRLGPLVKIAIIPEWDIFEDSAPISKNASRRMTTTMVMPITVNLKKGAYVCSMAKIGDKINAGERVILFNDFDQKDKVQAMLNAFSEEQRAELIETNATAKKSHYTGTIVDIDVITTVPLDDLSDSLREIVSNHWKRIKKREKLLDKYKNPDDYNFYKSGNIITQTASPVKTDYEGKIKGTKVDEGVLITFYVSFKDVMKKGDKLASQFALKSINSHVIDEGLEPYSESRPDEPIDLIVAPLSITARKTPSIFIAMFGNKILIEAKRHLKDYWFNN